MTAVATRRGPALLLVGVLTVAGCTAGVDDHSDEADRPPGRPSGTPSQTEPSPTSPPLGDELSPSDDPATLEEPSTRPVARRRGANPVVERIPDRQWRRMVAVGAWRPGCPVERQDLRRVIINHVTFSGEIRRGMLVVNKDVAASIVRVFTRLFEERFPIRRMRPVEKYDGDSNASLAAGNTSAYNCRRLTQINAPVKKSPHAHGRAIDINPRQNPWMDLRCDCWFPSSRNSKRVPGPGMIVKNGLVWRLFRREGWIWQNIDVPDYMHFDTGYPSRPYRGPKANKRAQARQGADGGS